MRRGLFLFSGPFLFPLVLALTAIFIHNYTQSPLSFDADVSAYASLNPCIKQAAWLTPLTQRKVKYMTGTNDSEWLEQLIAVAPEHEQMLRARDAITAAYCAEHGIDRNNPTIDQLLEIRALPEWQAAGEL